MEEIVKALTLKQQLDGLRPIEKEQEGRIMQKFRLDWNYHSNNLEGNSLTYGETKALIMFGITAQGKPLKDHSEIKGHNDAINWIEEVVKGDRPLTENFIRELHQLLLVEPYEVDAKTHDGKPTKKRIAVGSYKTSPNHVKTKTGEMFYFSTPEETPVEMAGLMAWYNEKSVEADVNPILLAAEFHYKFIRIHPFDDGNGRTARILMNFILMKFGFPPVIIKTEDKTNYFAALQLADAGNIEAFIEYIAANLNRSLDIMIAGARGEDIEESDDIDKEIALLEKRLLGISRSGTFDVEKQSVHELSSKIMDNIAEIILKKGFKLNNFYSDIITIYMTVDEHKQWFRSIDIDNSHFQDVVKFTLVITYSDFEIIGLEDIEYEANIICERHERNYSIYDKNKSIMYTKAYGVHLTENEMEKIAIAELKRHKDFIEQKIAEKEKEL